MTGAPREGTLRQSMDRLHQIVGYERSLAEVAQTLHFWARNTGASSYGALHVTCSDETEHECSAAFRQGFVQYLLPPLKFARPSAVRTANLGGRYEWGAIRIAEDHFATNPLGGGFKLIVAKINSHVAMETIPGVERPGERGIHGARSFRLGSFRRYGRESACCGALAATLGGSRDPFALDLAETLGSEGRDRLAALNDDKRVDPVYRSLFAAVVSARLQARKIVLDCQDHTPASPTLYLVLPCVTIDRHERDTEIPCGIYTVDARGGERPVEYSGLGDLPEAYRVERRNRRFVLSDEHVGSPRRGRDHRALVKSEWQSRVGDARQPVQDERLDRVRNDIRQNKHRHDRRARSLLRAALPILAEVAPVPAAVLMFADGAVGIHHAFRVHKLAREMSGSDEARRILDEIHERIDRLEPDRAEALVELLAREI